MTVQSPSTMLAIALRTLGFMLTVIDPSTLRRVNVLISSRLTNRESAPSVKVPSRRRAGERSLLDGGARTDSGRPRRARMGSVDAVTTLDTWNGVPR